MNKIYEIINNSSLYDNNIELIKKSGVVFTHKNICDKIIERLNPSINESICEPSVGKGSFVFNLLEYFRKNNTIEDIVNFVENRLFCYEINPDFVSFFKENLKLYFNLLGYENELCLDNIKCEDFLLSNNKYDIIIGNPPYIKIQNIENIEEYRKHFLTLKKGDVDIYFAFIEKSLQSCKKIGFIVPNSFIKTKSGGVVRELLKNRLSYIYDYNIEKVWKDISTYTCILICDEKSDDFVYETSTDKKTLNSFDKQDNGNKNSLFNMLNDYNFSLNTNKDSLYKMDSCDDFYCYKDGYKIEKDICVKYIKATTNTIGYVLYPYNINKIIVETELINKYPLGYKYLIDNKEILLSRDGGKIEKYDSWYAYGRKQGLIKKSIGKRIVIPILFLKSKGLHYISVDNNEDIVNFNSITLDIKEECYDDFIKILTSDDFYQYCQDNNRSLPDKNPENIWITIKTNSLKEFKF